MRFSKSVPVGHQRVWTARGSVRVLLWSCLLILLIKNPTAIYRGFPILYNGLFAAAFLIILCDALLMAQRVPLWAMLGSVSGTRVFGLFIYGAILIIAIDALAHGVIDWLKTLQFLANAAQFYALLYLVWRLGAYKDILSRVYRIAIVLALLSLLLWIGNFIGWVPLSPVPWESDPSGASVLWYVPFGFVTSPLPVSAARYRSCSVFSEPAYFGFFLLPFVFYGWHRFRHERRARHLLITLILLAALLTTSSVAAAAVAILAGLSLSLYSWLRRPCHLRPLVLSILLGAAGLLLYNRLAAQRESPTDPFLQVRSLSIDDRTSQWRTGWAYTKENVFGKGIGYSVPALVYQEALKQDVPYAEFTNILESVYYLGLVFVIPLGILLAATAHQMLRGLAARPLNVRIHATMLWIMFLYNASVQAFFTAYFLMMLAAYYLTLRDQELMAARNDAPNLASASISPASIIASRLPPRQKPPTRPRTSRTRQPS